MPIEKTLFFTGKIATKEAGDSSNKKANEIRRNNRQNEKKLKGKKTLGKLY